MAVGTIRVEGLRDLNRALGKYDKSLRKDLRKELRAIGEPVRARAEVKAVEEITNIGSRWSRVRMGVTQREVYIVPKARRQAGHGRQYGRPNLARKLSSEAYEPALEELRPQVIEAFDDMLARFGREAGLSG